MKAETALKQKRAMELLLAGATYTQIAEQLGLTHRGSAHHLVKDALLATIAPVADEVRATELARLDRLLLAVWSQAITPAPYQLLAIDRVLKIMAQRCLYIVGLKVPDRVAEVRPDGTSVYSPEIASQEFQSLMAALTARYQGDEALPEAPVEE
jgi:hypothetical protein